ncbi:MAG TPA: 5'-nucleotidase C-terminal domain-containing protein [Chitinophagaceae bacterium]|nr:5'-nucleotidase C-terminal domain-containing protein [Chitinophagaceae bacterium]
MKFPTRLYFLFVFIIAGCSSAWHISNEKVTQYKIKSEGSGDNSLTELLKPYYDQMSLTMNRVLAVSDVELIKKQPSCNMGNLFSDIVKYTAEKQYKTKIDIALFNYGGMRLTSLAPGNITVGRVYELSPFDNLIVVLKLNGKVLQDFLNLTALKGGWPISGGAYVIKDKKATQVLIDNKPLDENQTYNMATIDYVANGGDEANMLRNIPQLNKNIIMREAIISFLEELAVKGKHIVDIPEKRVRYAE